MWRYVDYAYMRLLVLEATQRVGVESTSTEHYSGESAIIQYWVDAVRLTRGCGNFSIRAFPGVLAPGL